MGRGRGILRQKWVAEGHSEQTWVADEPGGLARVCAVQIQMGPRVELKRLWWEGIAGDSGHDVSRFSCSIQKSVT